MGFAAAHRGAPLALPKLSKPACLGFDVIGGELQTATECLTSCSMPTSELHGSYNVYTCESLDSRLPSQAWGHTHPLDIDPSSKCLHHWTNRWSCFRSEESLLLSALRKLFEGSSLLGSAIMPDLDASGRKAPVRMRCRISSNCLIGSASKSLLYISCFMRVFSGATIS